MGGRVGWADVVTVRFGVIPLGGLPALLSVIVLNASAHSETTHCLQGTFSCVTVQEASLRSLHSSSLTQWNLLKVRRARLGGCCSRPGALPRDPLAPCRRRRQQVALTHLALPLRQILAVGLLAHTTVLTCCSREEAWGAQAGRAIGGCQGGGAGEVQAGPVGAPRPPAARRG